MVFLSSCFDSEKGKKDKISIVCTAFSQYDFVKEIVGEKSEKFDIKYLFENGADVHSFETDVGFNVKIQILNSDLFIYNGGESDSWAKNILEDKSMNKDCVKVSLISALDEKRLLMSNHDEHEHSHEDDHKDKYDEHVWLSIENAISICYEIKNAIVTLDETNKSYYEENTEKYCSKLNSLHEEAISSFSKFENPFVVVADRYPFVYFFNDYNIRCTAAFSGCTSETEATYENVVKLCKAVEENSLKYILVLEKSNASISSAVVSSSPRKLEILTINSLQSVSREEIEDGISYYSVMKNNIETVKKALVTSE